MSDAQRTHKPSAKRKKEFRQRGEIAMSRDLVSAASLAGAVIGLTASLSHTAGSIADLARTAVQAGDGRAIDDIGSRCAHTFVAATAPALIGAALGAVIATLAQLGWPPAIRRPSFDLARMSPAANLKNVFSPGAALRRVGGALLKLAIIGATVVAILHGVDQLEPVTAAVAAPRIAGLVMRVLLAATCAFAAVAVIDYILTRRKIMAKMRMTPEEVKREFKEQEGDPTVKGQRKRKARELAKRRVAAAVKSATVVIVNPTHYAVALRYDDGADRAPIVVAKGVDESAERIRELARHHGVPILSRPPLARALHKAVPEGREVPVALYRAVAEVLAYVYRLKAAAENSYVNERRTSSLVMIVALVGVLGVAIAPLPPTIFDFLIGISLCLATLTFLVAFYVERPTDFTSFPSLLLFVTLFRLSLNVASTRLILTGDGDHAAGAVISAFGDFAIGGNFVVGAIIFLVLVVVNFVVITKGAERISEVAARFTLDSMPGKQMAIDADLGAGLITEKVARERRLHIQRDADFHGAMDGASKFVRGDAIAGLLILAINAIGGVIIGVAQKDMSIGAAVQRYTVMSIGDGLVSQIPALLISTGAALLTTRGDDKQLGKAMSSQLMARRKPLLGVAGLLATIGLLPGMPHVIFISLAAIAAWASTKAKGPAAATDEADGVPAGKPGAAPASGKGDDAGKAELEAMLPVELLSLEVGLDLLGLVDAGRSGELLKRIASLRKQLATELGVIVPPIHIRDDLRLRPGGYRVLLSGVPIAEGEVQVHRVLAIDPTGTATRGLPGEATTEPTFGLPAKWLVPSERSRAEAAGCTVVDSAAVIATHLAELIRRHAHELLGRREVQELLDVAGKQHSKVIEDLIPHHMSMTDLIRVLRNLLRENVSIRDLRSILEGLADHAPVVKNADELTDFVRQRLARRLTRSYLGADGSLRPLVLDPRAEAVLRDGGVKNARALSRIAEDLAARAREMSVRDEPTVLVVAPDLRRTVAGIAARHVPGLAVLSYREVDPSVPFVTRGIVSAQEAA